MVTYWWCHCSLFQWYVDLDSQASKKHYGLIILQEFVWYSQLYSMCLTFMSSIKLMEEILFAKSHSLYIIFQVYFCCHLSSLIHTFLGLWIQLDFYMESASFSHNLNPSITFMQLFCSYSNTESIKNLTEISKDIGFQDIAWTLSGFSLFSY